MDPNKVSVPPIQNSANQNRHHAPFIHLRWYSLARIALLQKKLPQTPPPPGLSKNSLLVSQEINQITPR